MRNLLIIVVSLILSLLMSIMPLPEVLLPINPSWSLLTVLFLTYGKPDHVGIGIAWCIGLFMDGLTGSLLGIHACSFVIIVGLFDLLYRQFHMFHILQQSLVIGVLALCNFFITSWAAHLLAGNVVIWPMILSAVTSAIVWPFYRVLGQKLDFIRG